MTTQPRNQTSHICQINPQLVNLFKTERRRKHKSGSIVSAFVLTLWILIFSSLNLGTGHIWRKSSNSVVLSNVCPNYLNKSKARNVSFLFFSSSNHTLLPMKGNVFSYSFWNCRICPNSHLPTFRLQLQLSSCQGCRKARVPRGSFPSSTGVRKLQVNSESGCRHSHSQVPTASPHSGSDSNRTSGPREFAPSHPGSPALLV